MSDTKYLVAWNHIPFIKCTTDIDELEAQLEYPEGP